MKESKIHPKQSSFYQITKKIISVLKVENQRSYITIQIISVTSLGNPKNNKEITVKQKIIFRQFNQNKGKILFIMIGIRKNKDNRTSILLSIYLKLNKKSQNRNRESLN